MSAFKHQPGTSIIKISRSSLALTTKVRTTDYIETIGDLISSF